MPVRGIPRDRFCRSAIWRWLRVTLGYDITYINIYHLHLSCRDFTHCSWENSSILRHVHQHSPPPCASRGGGIIASRSLPHVRNTHCYQYFRRRQRRQSVGEYYHVDGYMSIMSRSMLAPRNSRRCWWRRAFIRGSKRVAVIAWQRLPRQVPLNLCRVRSIVPGWTLDRALTHSKIFWRRTVFKEIKCGPCRCQTWRQRRWNWNTIRNWSQHGIWLIFWWKLISTMLWRLSVGIKKEFVC